MKKKTDPASMQTSVASNTVLMHVGMTLREAEKFLIVATIKHTEGNVREAARILGIDRSTLYEKTKLYDIVEWTRGRRTGVGKLPEEC